MKYDIRPLTLSEILDQTFKVLRDNFWLLLGIVLAVTVPLAVLFWGILHIVAPKMVSVLSGTMTPEQAAGFGREIQTNLPVLIAAFGLNIVVHMLAYLVTNAGVVWAVSNRYLGRSAGVGESLRAGLSRLLTLVGSMIAAGFLIMIGFIFLIIPGIYLTLRYWLLTQAIMVEGQGAIGAMGRSGKLMRGNMGVAFILAFILSILTGIIGTVAAFIPHWVASVAVQTLVQAFNLVLLATANVIFYYSNRCKLENFDLTILAEAFDIKPEDEEGPLARGSDGNGPSVS